MINDIFHIEGARADVEVLLLVNGPIAITTDAQAQSNQTGVQIMQTSQLYTRTRHVYRTCRQTSCTLEPDMCTEHADKPVVH